MTAMTTPRERRAAVRRDRNGSGPTVSDEPIARFPGAAAKFALFGDVLLTGLLVVAVGVLVITLPAGLAAGIRHLKRTVRAEDSRLALFWRDALRALPGGAVLGLAALVATAVLLLDIDLGRGGFLPGGALEETIGWAGLAVTGLVVLLAARLWTPEAGWLAALRGVPVAVRIYFLIVRRPPRAIRVVALVTYTTLLRSAGNTRPR